LLPFAHFMAGTLAYLALKKSNKTRLNWLIAGFIGLMPDFDIIIPDNIALLAHRNLSHTIIPATVIIGLLTLFMFKSFWLGFIPIATHFILDVINGTVAIIPNQYITLNLIPSELASQAAWTGIIGTTILTFWIITAWKQKCQSTESITPAKN